MRHQQLVIFQAEEIADPPMVVPRRATLAVYVFVELLAIEVELPADGRYGSIVIAAKPQVFAIGVVIDGRVGTHISGITQLTREA